MLVLVAKRPLSILSVSEKIQQHRRKTAMLPERKGLDLFTLPAKIRVGLAATETALLFRGLRHTGVSRAPGSKESSVVNRSSSRHDGAGDDGSANERVLHVECKFDRLLTESAGLKIVI